MFFHAASQFLISFVSFEIKENLKTLKAITDNFHSSLVIRIKLVQEWLIQLYIDTILSFETMKLNEVGVN